MTVVVCMKGRGNDLSTERNRPIVSIRSAVMERAVDGHGNERPDSIPAGDSSLYPVAISVPFGAEPATIDCDSDRFAPVALRLTMSRIL